jgi:NADH dehydrogenase
MAYWSHVMPSHGATPSHRVVIVGGGFGGLTLARGLRHAPLAVTLVDRRNFHLFQPLLYQVATGGLSPANIAAPLRSILRRYQNVRVVLGEVVAIDVATRQVQLHAGQRLPYDTLVLATGARHHYFGHPEWEAVAPGLKTVEDATAIRCKILSAFEAAELESQPEKRLAWMTFVIVGGGPTGVELAGTLGELARFTLRHDYRSVNPAQARVFLLEGTERVLGTFSPKLSAKTIQGLNELGVTVLTGALVTDIRADGVTFKRGDQTERLATHTVLWAAGVAASPLGPMLAAATGVATDRAGRVEVGPDLSVPGHSEIFVLGDLASCRDAQGKPLPGVAPVAMQQGAYLANVIRRRLDGKDVSPFRYRDRGNLATIGRARAVADLGWLRLWGYPAWLVWLIVHLSFIVTFDNRILVLFQWAWNYFTRNRSARLITGDAEG